MINPLVSIIIPLYNAKDYIAETIKSAINQTWQNKEIIIVDDGSTDNSLAIAKTFENGFVKIFTQKNSGASAARNKGLTEAKGDYIQFLDADDLLSADKIESQVNLLQGKPNAVANCATVYFFDGEDPLVKKPIHEWHHQDSIDNVHYLIKLYGGYDTDGHGNMITVHAWLTPRSIIDKVGPWNEDLTVDDDGEYFCRVLLTANSVKYSPLSINYYRKFGRPKSLSTQKTKQAFQSKLLATDLKYEHLKSIVEPALLKKTMAKFYWEIGVSAYPRFITLSNMAIKKAKKLNYNGPKYVAGKASVLLSKILGWRMVRILSVIRYGF